VVAVNDRDANGKAIDTAALYAKAYDDASWFKDAKAGKFLTGGNGALTGTVVQDIYIDEDVKKICGGDGRTLGFSAPVVDAKGRVVGVWNNRANFSLLESMLTSAGHDLKTQGLTDVRLTLIDRGGRIIADYDPTRAENDALSRSMDVLLTVNLADRGVTSAREARSGHDGVAHEEDPRRGVWQMTGYAASRGARDSAGACWRGSMTKRRPMSAAIARAAR
jgi:hypothetical protein